MDTGERLTEEELTLHGALETNDSAVKVLPVSACGSVAARAPYGTVEARDYALRTIARELVKTVRANVTIDWTLRETIRAQMRVLVRRIPRKYNYPPDKQEKATLTVLERAEVLCEEWGR